MWKVENSRVRGLFSILPKDWILFLGSVFYPSIKTVILFAIEGNKHTFNQVSFKITLPQILLTDDLAEWPSSISHEKIVIGVYVLPFVCLNCDL